MENRKSTSITEVLLNLPPEHDTPVGLIHPYWARKPLNVIQELVSYFSNEGDLIADPFVGSGTTAFAALIHQKRIVGSDLNPLAFFLTRSIIELCQSPNEKLAALDQFVSDFSHEVLPWYHFKDNLYVERERFQVIGDFEGGKFELINSEIILKTLTDGKFRGRITERVSSSWMKSAIPERYLHFPLDFEKLTLLPNSRIAIPNRANLSQFYEVKNRAAINVAINLINSGEYGTENDDVLKLLISSSLPLLRLSDKKATSQWPYWRPKDQLTSRNPLMVLNDKVLAIRNASAWLEQNIESKVRGQLSDYLTLLNLPIQSLSPTYIKPNSIDLIITDPPYSDQAPYLEYSSLWIQILGLNLPNDAFKYEIVQSDAPNRRTDTEEYPIRLREALRVCTEILKPDGTLIWFYQDNIIEHWSIISDEVSKRGMFISEVIPMQKQRRSIKTVTTPGKTLDGDLILIFKKGVESRLTVDNLEQALQLIKEKIDVNDRTLTYFEKYAVIVEIGLKYDLMPILGEDFSDIREIIDIVETGN